MLNHHAEVSVRTRWEVIFDRRCHLDHIAVGWRTNGFRDQTILLGWRTMCTRLFSFFFLNFDHVALS